MAYMRQAGSVKPYESHLYQYWIIVLQLLKLGVAWEAIMNFTEEEVILILGIEMAIQQKQQDEQMRDMARNQGKSSVPLGAL